jgi:hypothetical protein
MPAGAAPVGEQDETTCTLGDDEVTIEHRDTGRNVDPGQGTAG